VSFDVNVNPVEVINDVEALVEKWTKGWHW
jgi:hypothetical protein